MKRVSAAQESVQQAKERLAPAALGCRTVDKATVTERVARAGEGAEEQTVHCPGCQDETVHCRAG